MNHQDAPSGANATASTTATLAPVVMAERAAVPPTMPPPAGLHDPREVMRREGRKGRSYCGPWALMAITGRPYADIRARINRGRSRPDNRAVMGTHVSELERVLRRLGYGIWDLRFGCGHRPTLAALLRGRTSRERQQTWVVAAAKHWVVVRGDMATCAMLDGWASIDDMKKRRGRVTCVLVVEPPSNAAH
jgi:hypothetical protein